MRIIKIAPEAIIIKWKSEEIRLEPDKRLQFGPSPYNDLEVTLRELGWVSTLIGYISTQKALKNRILTQKKAEIYLDLKTGTTTPISDTYIFKEIEEDKEISSLALDVELLGIGIQRLEKYSKELELKIGVLRSLLVNERVEKNLQS